MKNYFKNYFKKLIAYLEIGAGIVAFLLLIQDILYRQVVFNAGGFSVENFILYSVLFAAIVAWVADSVKNIRNAG